MQRLRSNLQESSNYRSENYILHRQCRTFSRFAKFASWVLPSICIQLYIDMTLLHSRVNSILLYKYVVCDSVYHDSSLSMPIIKSVPGTYRGRMNIHLNLRQTYKHLKRSESYVGANKQTK